MSLDPLQKKFWSCSTHTPATTWGWQARELELYIVQLAIARCSRCIWWLFWWYYYTEWLQVQESIGSIDYERWQGMWNAVMLHLNTASNLWKLPHHFSYRLGTELGGQLVAYALTLSHQWPSMVNHLDMWLYIYCIGLNIYVQGHTQGFKHPNPKYIPLKSMPPMLSYHTGWPSRSSPKKPPGKYFTSTFGKMKHSKLKICPPVHIYHDRQTST